MKEEPARRRQAVAWSVLFGYGTLAVALARNIFLVPVYLHHIALDEYGAWLATGGALVQMLVTDFGLAGVITQRVAHRFGDGKEGSLGSLIGAGLVNGMALALLLTALCLALAPFIPATSGLSPDQTRRVLHCFLLAVGANCVGVLGNTTVGIVRSLQRAIGAGSIVLIADLASVLATVGALIAGLGLYALPIGLLVRSVLSTAGSLGLLASLWAHDLRLRPRFSWLESRQVWRDSAQFFLTSIAMRLQSNANTLFVGAMSGPESAAIYGLTVRAHETVLLLISQINVALGPSLAHLVGARQQARFRQLLLGLLPTMAVIAAVALTVTVALNQSFVSLWVGARLFGGQSTSILMGVALWVASIGYVAYEALLAHGEFRMIARTFIGASALHVALLFTLLRFGMWGAPGALLIATLMWCAVLWRRVALDAELKRRELAGLAVDLLVVAVVAVAGGLALALWYPRIGTWPSLCGEAAVCGAVVAIAVLLLRPGLRRLLRAELSWTARSMRARSSS